MLGTLSDELDKVSDDKQDLGATRLSRLARLGPRCGLNGEAFGGSCL